MLYFNAQHGYVEGLARGLRVGLLNSQNYLNLTQCETLGSISVTLVKLMINRGPKTPALSN